MLIRYLKVKGGVGTEVPTWPDGNAKGLTHAKTAVRRCGALLVLWLASGCAANDGDAGDEVGTSRQAIENGELRPSVHHRGVVQLTIAPQDARNPDEKCSGQVISRDTLLTAAHCFHRQGYFRDGWQEAVLVDVRVRHQNPDGSWDNLTANKETVTVHVREAYVAFADVGADEQYGTDIAVVRRSSKWSQIGQSDVSALARYSTEGTNWLYLYGYGYHTDTQYDGQLRRGGVFGGIGYVNVTSNALYRTMFALVHASTGTHSCRGDSGGPWKVPPTQSNFSGLQFGVHVMGDNDGLGHCSNAWAFATMVAHHDDWIEQKVKTGAGSCSKVSVPVTIHGESNVQTIRAKVCW